MMLHQKLELSHAVEGKVSIACNSNSLKITFVINVLFNGLGLLQLVTCTHALILLLTEIKVKLFNYKSKLSLNSRGLYGQMLK